MTDMMTIGEFSRASGLTVSALRFYDSVGALVPAEVDPQTSYRWYAVSQVADGRLVSRLRRVGMPVAEMRLLVQRRDDPALVSALLAEHLERLEEGLDAARRELVRIRADVGVNPGCDPVPDEYPCPVTEFSVGVAGLLSALGAVRFALPSESDPVLSAILFDIGAASVTLVATDRYRMALSELAGGERVGPAVRAAVPQDRLSELERFLNSGGGGDGGGDGDGLQKVAVVVSGRFSRWKIEDRELELELSVEEFPEYRAIVDVLATRQVSTSNEQARDVLRSRPASLGRGVDGALVDVAILSVNESGELVTRPDNEAQDCVVVNVEYLLEAMDALADGQLVLDLASPISPLAIRFADRPGTFSVLMPTRLS